MPAAPPPDWDIFCNVVDNYGDIGVCWRLARQLAAEQHLRVRLWVDDLKSFQPLCPDIDVQLASQMIAGVEIRYWPASFPEATPGSIVIEAFGCRIPECFVAAMVQRKPQPVWINLEYLSAEPWVAGCHALSSPHPRLPLVKYFYFPGFSLDTGGLLRERDLHSRKQAFETSPALQLEFWQSLGFPPPADNALKISLFAYENPAISDLLHAWEASATPVCCLLPLSRARCRWLRHFVGIRSRPAILSSAARCKFVFSPSSSKAVMTCCSGPVISTSFAAKTHSCAPSGQRNRWSGTSTRRKKTCIW